MTNKWGTTKTYTHNEGLSCAFRQWRAESHCKLIHGYALQFSFLFEAEQLDDRNWVADFGDLKELKEWLHEVFDHTFVVAADDPHRAVFETLDELGLIDLRILPDVGCEKFAEFAFKKAQEIVFKKYRLRVRVAFVEVKEHAGNGATYTEFSPKI